MDLCPLYSPVCCLCRSRPFYFHTDESKLSELFKAVAAEGVKPKPVVFPAV